MISNSELKMIKLFKFLKDMYTNVVITFQIMNNNIYLTLSIITAKSEQLKYVT